MDFHVMTLFPQMIEQGFLTSITGRAVENGKLALHTVNIRDYTEDKHKKVDDYPYGGGAGMLMQAQPVYDAWQAVRRTIEDSTGLNGKKGTPPRVIYVTPQGRVFDQELAEELSKEEQLVFLCGHYEGIDERVLEEIVTDYVSIGDYVLTGGELPALVIMDAVARLVPDVLHNGESAETESFHNSLLEHPHYTRPEVWHNSPVPPVLLSGDHKKIADWRAEQSVRRTGERRPDLYRRYQAQEELVRRLMRDKVLHADMADALKRGSAKVLHAGPGTIVLLEKQSRILMVTAFPEGTFPEGTLREEELPAAMREDGAIPEGSVLHQEALALWLSEKQDGLQTQQCRQALYTRGAALPVAKEITIEKLDAVSAENLCVRAGIPQKGLWMDSFYAAMDNSTGAVQGFIGMHQSGSMDALFVFEPYRRMGVARALEADCINRLLRAGRMAYGRIPEENGDALSLQEALGLRISKTGLRVVKRTAEQV